MTWEEARTTAAASQLANQQGYLVTVTSAEEQSFLASSFGFQTFWLGATDVQEEGTWRWQDGPVPGEIFYVHGQDDQPGFSNWNYGEPNNLGDEDYAHWLYQGAWNDLSSFDQGPYVLIEYGGLPADDTNMGMVAGDTLLGGDGDDTLQSRGDNDSIDGGAGRDQLFLDLTENSSAISLSLTDSSLPQSLPGGGTVVNVEMFSIQGGRGNDSIVGGSYYASFNGGAGDDLLDLGDGGGVASGGAGNDHLRVDDGYAVLSGGDGDDRLDVGSGGGQAYGQAGHDHLVAGSGSAILYGGDGDDLLDLGSGGGSADGEAGEDLLRAILPQASDSVSYQLDGGSGNDRISVTGAHAGVVHLLGGGGLDSLVGGEGNDELNDTDGSFDDAFYNPLNGHWYRLLPTTTTWEGAKAAAAASWLGNVQGYLVTITSAEEQDFLTTTFGYPSAWIGASDEQDEGTWRWVGGPEAGMMFYVQGQESQTGFNHWSPGEPNNLGEEDAAGFWIGNNSWNDFSATTLQSLLIEYGGTSADPSEPVTQPGDTLFGGAGNDTIISRGDTDQIDGGAGIDRLALDLSKTTAAVSLSLADPTAVQNLPGGGSVVNVEVLQLTSGSGDDSIVGGEGYDILSGAAGDDVLDVGPGGGEAYGGAGRDHLRGSGTESSLLLKGGAGDDLFEVGAGGGQALGEAGDDVLQATLGGAEDPGSLSLNGGPGNDRLSVTGRLMGYVELDGGGGQDSLSGGMGNDVLLDGDGRGEDAVFTPTNGHWYRLITTSMSWEEARATASNSQLANRQGYLVTITSQEEQEFLKQAFDFNGVWLGASDADEEGTWRWLDGPEAGTVFHVQGQEVQPDYSNWDLGEPSGFSGENVAGTWLYNFTWNDFDQHEFTRYLLIEYGGMPNDSLEAVVLPGDTLQGGDGDDQIMSRGDTDQIDGGGGMDQLSWDLSRTSADLTLSLADPSVVQVLPGGGSVVNVEMIDLVSGSGNDSLQGGSGFDRLNGEAGNDVLDLWSGGGSASGGEGDDVLLAALTNEHRDGSVYLDGNAGNDRIRVTGAHSTYVRLTGGGGLDSLQGSDGNDVLDDGDNGYEDAVFNPLNGHWYRYLPGAMTWDQARTAAAASRFLDRQGYVVTITSAQEQAFLRSMFGSYFSAWIGASDAAEEGTWRWVDGPEAGHVFFVQGQDPQPGYSNWAEGQPEGDWDSGFELGVDEDVAGFFGYWSGNNLWHDMPIDQRLSLLIEYGGTSGDGSNAMYPSGDTLLGGDGDDTIVSQGGSDQIDGGTGLDQLSLNFSLITWDLSCSFADSSLRQLLPFGGSVVNVEALDLETGSGDDTIVGGSGYDTLYGGAGDDHLDLGLGGGSAYGE
ncbi:MAG: lectin-like protein, partial [Cyanobacteriota bacterium]